MKNLTSTTKKYFWNIDQGQNGFTLIEVVVSMVILSVGIFGLIKTASSVIYYQDSSRLMTEATLITTNKIENTKRYSANEPTGGAYGFNYLVTDYLTDEVFTEISDQNYRKVETDGVFTVTTNLLIYPSTSTDNFDSPGDIHMLEVLVTTAWTDSRGQAKNIEMASVLHRRQFVE
jgi:prepilin-type N-terminal cleavage/methylation domain-containing protein